MQCIVVFELQLLLFPSEHFKVAYVILLLSGKARLCATSESEHQSSICASYNAFCGELCKVFDVTVPKKNADQTLFQMTQGNRSATKLAVDFCKATVWSW